MLARLVFVSKLYSSPAPLCLSFTVFSLLFQRFSYDCMTPSPPRSPKSDPSSRPSSSPIDSAFYDPNTPRPPALPPISHISFQPPILPPTSNTMGAAGPIQSSSTPDVPPPSFERPRHSRRKSDDSVRPSSSGSSRQAIEEDSPAGGPAPSGSAPGGPGYPAHGKKKRTRTLTTPHQSAVLHALLAQSRFPTTAMREEVGRSIGLSARKVQVWFQNQRQKARKPRTQSTAPLGRPPQFGPFPSGPTAESPTTAGPSGSSDSFQSASPPEISPQTYTPEHLPGYAFPRGLPAPHAGMVQYNLDVPGYSPNRQSAQRHPHPGMEYMEPGPSSTSRSEPRGFTPPPPHGFFPPHGLLNAPQPPYPVDPYMYRPPERTTMRRSSDPPIVLPPLRFDQPRGGPMQGPLPPLPFHGGESRISPHSAPFPTLPPPPGTSPRSSSPGPAYNLPPPSRHGEGIPPPFTLQPAPQWEPSNPIPGPTPTLNPPTGPSAFGSREYPRPPSHRRRSDPPQTLPPLSMQVEPGRPRDPPLLTQPWPSINLPPIPSASSGTGGRRFDPVHSVVRGDRESRGSGEDTGGNGSRRNRHTYDFARRSGSMVTLSPPRPPDDHEPDDRSD